MKLENLTGQRFGRLVAKSMAPKRRPTATPWNCLCDCGETTIANASALKNGEKQSCGCYRRDKGHASLHDLTGQRFERLCVLERAKNDKSRAARWLCRCDCGNEKIVSGATLASGGAKSCGCYRPRREMSNLIDLTGQRFERLKVIGRADDIRGRAAWKCQCDCGNTTTASSGALRFKSKRSCGCLAREINDAQLEDLTGRKFGSLTVDSLVRRQPDRIWRCVCDCGAIKNCWGGHLKRGSATSCGCQSTGTGFNSSISASFYYLKVPNPYGGAPLYKIGITNRSVKARYRGDSRNFEHLLVANFAMGANARKLEQSLLKAFAAYIYQGPPILKAGDSELFTKDILNLDNLEPARNNSGKSKEN